MRPHRPSRRAVLGGVTAVPLAAAVTALESAPEPAAAARRVPADLRPGGAFDRFVADLAGRDQFAGNVATFHSGRPVLARSYGTAGPGSPHRPGTVFNLASLTKVFTGLAVARLVQDGRAAFHTPLAAYLDGFPAGITVHQLLTHTSGLGDYSRSPGFAAGLGQWNSAAASMAGVVDLIRREPSQFPPGTRFGYSNSGFFVLGALVERVTGEPFADAVRRMVFTPAGMTDAAFHTRPEVLANARIARPYATAPGGGRTDFTASPYFGFVGGPADGAYATVADLARFAARLRAGGVLLPAFTRLVTTGKIAQSPDDSPPEPSRVRAYGYGWRTSIVGTHAVFGHSGSGPGRATNLDIFPDADWVVVVLSNYDTGVAPIVRLARQLITEGS
jgi:CubicO group peptidase (beta-lactamase class C family)